MAHFGQKCRDFLILSECKYALHKKNNIYNPLFNLYLSFKHV